MTGHVSTRAALCIVIAGAAWTATRSPQIVAQTPAEAPTSQTERFDAIVQAALEGQGAGAAVAVIAHGELVYQKTFGLANIETREPVTLDTVWAPTGVSEMYSAAVAASLAQDGTLALDEPVARYWPALNPLVGRVTIRQLFQQRAGIVDEHTDYALLDPDALRRYALSLTSDCVIAEPGYLQSYSSRSANIAAAVIEQAAGSSFEKLLTARVFKPFGFTRSSLSILDVATQPIAQGHRAAGAGVEVVRPLALNLVGWPTTSIFTSLREGAVFLGAIVNGGRWQGRQVLSRRVADETVSLLPRAAGAPAVESSTGWAGIRALHILVPAKQFGFLLLVNGPTRGAIAKIVAGVAELFPESAGASLATPVDPSAAVTTRIAEKEAAELIGVYRNEWKIRIEWKSGSLMFRDEGTSFRAPTDWIRVDRISENQLLVADPSLAAGARLTLVRSASGDVTHIVQRGRALRKEQP